MTLPDDVEPVTAAQAGARLDRAAATIRCWAVRYAARQLGKVGRTVYYDFGDLALIERQMRRGEPVPPTPEQRAALSPARSTHAA